MLLGRVIGQVVPCVVTPGLEGVPLLEDGRESIEKNDQEVRVLIARGRAHKTREAGLPTAPA